MRTISIAAAVLCASTAVAQTQAVATSLSQRVEEKLVAFTRAGGVPGVSVGIASSDESLALAAGERARGTGEPLKSDALLCAGSTGKTFVAAVVLQLVQEGELSLEDFAGDHLGDEEWFERLPNAFDLTLENLLAHRSGLPRYVFQPAFVRDLVDDPERVWEPHELLAYVLDQPPLLEAGQGFAYSDTNYIVLGMIVERVTEATLYAEVQERLLGPLKLTHVRPQDGRIIEGLVQGHAGPRDPLGLPDLVLDAEGRFCINPQFEWAGGGFVSNGGDLARWARALYAGDVLAPELRARMAKGLPARGLGPGTAYGLGAMVWSTPHGQAVGHEGFFPGYMSHVRYWPEHDVAIAVQVNTSDFSALPGPLGVLCDELLEVVLAE
jgi:D-alanyl-D-alanine carboxypeptidase